MYLRLFLGGRDIAVTKADNSHHSQELTFRRTGGDRPRMKEESGMYQK
jgi:hypothetical protein